MTTDKKKYDELRKKVEFQVKCEERAYRIVERLIENPVTEEFFQESLNFITPSHYHDIVEERAVSKLCGYPLCPNPLKKVLTQKYMISTKTNKVYDIEERKNFCSGKCYKASVHVQKQISSAPVWTRKSHPPVPFSFLPLDMDKGKVGEEVFLNMADDLREEIKTIEKMDKYQQHLKERKAKSSNFQGSQRVSDGHTEHTSDREQHVYTLDRMMKEIGIDEKEEEIGISENSNDDNQMLVKSSQERASIECANLGQNSDCVTRLPSVKQSINLPPNLDCATRETSPKQTGIKNMNLSPNVDTLTGQPSGSCDSSSDIKGKRDDISSLKTSKPVKCKSKEPNPQTEYLMKLLDKRKALLSKMADIQQTDTISSDKQVQSDANKVLIYDSANHENNLKQEEIGNERSIITKASLCDYERRSETAKQQPEANIKEQDQPQTRTNATEDTTLSAKKIEEVQSDTRVQLPVENQNLNDSELEPLAARKIAEDKNVLTRKVEKIYTDVNVKLSKENENPEESEIEPLATKPIGSPIYMIVEVLKAWITKESVQYLSVDVTSDSTENKDMFDKQYKELVAKVDAQEKDFDNMLGEEVIDETETGGKASVPDYEQLKRETEENNLRVNAFLSGAFTYQIKEKTPVQISTKGTSEVVLPTVDRYNQMLIRQKIVLDRISKVLPELLSPLRLLIQDVFTELRELVSTFELTSENILFKPAEWMLVTLVLLKLLCGRIKALEQAFNSPRVMSHFGILLRAVNCDTKELDSLVQSLLYIFK